MKKYLLGTLLLASMGLASCGDSFLEEENTTAYSTDYLETVEGVKAQAAALYGNIRWHFGYEWAYGITLYGTDEFTSANDLTNEPWNKYDSRLGAADITTSLGAANGNCTSVSFLWDEMYYGISAANNVIRNGEALTDSDLDLYIGEGYFLRGYNYYRLFAQYGGVVLVTEPTEGVVRNFTRSSEEETLNLIISDFEKAYELLPTKKDMITRGYGGWTKYTAAHFLAKALLYRQSERSESWNSSYDKSTDLTRCISLCNEVIAACPLEDDYNDLFNNWTDIDCALEGSDEILMSAQHNGDSSTQGRYGNRSYNYFNCQWQTASAKWVQRGVWIGGMEFQRCRPTEYNYKCFDNVNDARLWKSFRTVFGITSIVDATNCVAGTISPAQTSDTGLGDEGIMFILNTKDDDRFDDVTFGAAGSSEFINPETGKWVPNATALYQNGEFIGEKYGTATGDYCNFWPGLNKTEDGSRLAEKGDAHRDVTMARTGETVLIKAEAQVRLGNYSDAITTINTLRTRAQWKASEDRGSYIDATQAFVNNTLYSQYQANYENANTRTNTYWLSTGLDEDTDNYQASNLQISSYSSLPAEDEEILSELGCSGDYDRMLNFVFNERTRELDGEWNRWEELARCKLLHRRTIQYNTIAAENLTIDQNSNGSHFLYRAIPQTFIDGLLNDDGSVLTDEQQDALQNPGY